MIKLHIWFQDEDWLFLEFVGQFDHNATWYRPLWTRIRMELGARYPEEKSGWVKFPGGTYDAVWRLGLRSAYIRNELSPEEAYRAVERAVHAFSVFPHHLNIELEVI